MNKKITVHFYDCCLHANFGGHHRPVLQWHVDGATTRKELCSGLLSGLAHGIIDRDIEQNGLDYDAIKQAVKGCLYFADHCKDNDIVFPKLDKYDDSEWDDVEHDYAFFIVDWSDEE